MDKKIFRMMEIIILVLGIVTVVLLFMDFSEPEFIIYKEKCEEEINLTIIHGHNNSHHYIRSLPKNKELPIDINIEKDTTEIKCSEKMKKIMENVSKHKLEINCYKVDEKICKKVEVDRIKLYGWDCSVYEDGTIEKDFQERAGYYEWLFEERNYTSFEEMKEEEKQECLENINKTLYANKSKENLTGGWLDKNCECYTGTNQDGEEIYQSCDFFPKKIGDETIEGTSKWKCYDYIIKKI